MSRRTRVMALAAAALLATVLLGWLTAYGVGLTSSSAATGSTIEAFPSAPAQTDSWSPEFGGTLDLDDVRAGRATRKSSAATTPATHAATATAPASSTAPPSTAAPRAEPTPAAVHVVGQGDACSTEGATARTRSGARVVCVRAPGKGDLRWRRG